ncbi:hypothetical protein HK100_007879, partial [Physocladia obscura]
HKKTVDGSPANRDHFLHSPHLQTQTLPSIRQHQPAPEWETPKDCGDEELLSYREFAVETHKMTDLEIENESLIAMNASLQNTVRSQARNVVQMRRMINSLKRKSCDSEMLGSSESPNTEQHNLDIISPESQNNYRLSLFSSNSINVSVDATFVESVEAHHQSEQYDIFCSTISQLIEDGQRALNETPIVETNSNNSTPQVSRNSMQLTRTVSSIFEPRKNLPDSGRIFERQQHHIELDRDAISADSNLLKNEQEKFSSTASNRSDCFDMSQENAERFIEGRCIITERNQQQQITLASLHNDSAVDFPRNYENGANDARNTIQIPVALYNTFIELIDDVNQDLEARYLRHRILNNGNDDSEDGRYSGGSSKNNIDNGRKRRHAHGQVIVANYFARTGFFGWIMNIIRIRRTFFFPDEYRAQDYLSDNSLKTDLNQTMNKYVSVTESMARLPLQLSPSSVPIPSPPFRSNIGSPLSSNSAFGTAVVKIMHEYHVDNFLAEFCFRVFVTKMID